MLEELSLSTNIIYISNIIKCSPTDNRNLLPLEIEKGEPYFKKQLSIIKPKLIVTLGRLAAFTIVQNKDALNLRNQIFKYQGVDLVVTYHPAALLRNPNLNKYEKNDFDFIKYNYLLKN